MTGIRHWSTPEYSRIAIDMEGDVKFSSQRIARPSRIFFDLPDTKLASTLVGKSYDVDDGFLKKIRMAQFAPGRTRVVLEVDKLSDYDAFLLPNPYRLIIDIHSKDGGAKQLKDASEMALAAGEGMALPKVGPSDTRLPSTEVYPAIGHAMAGAGKDSLSGNLSGDTPVASSASAASKRVQTAVVKRVVEADDDDGPVAVAKANPPELKAAFSKKQTASGPASGLDTLNSPRIGERQKCSG